MSLWRTLRGIVFPASAHGRSLEGFLDSLLQSFENRRPGLGDDVLADPAAVEAYFREAWPREREQLRGLVDRQSHLAPDVRGKLFDDVCALVETVVLPAYARLAGRVTARERNGFYITPEHLHVMERAAFAFAGICAGVFAIRAPFIPIWADAWVLLFAFCGLVFPELRRFLALRGYESAINEIEQKADDEVWRLDLSYMSAGMQDASAAPDARAESDAPAEPDEREAPDASPDRTSVIHGRRNRQKSR